MFAALGILMAALLYLGGWVPSVEWSVYTYGGGFTRNEAHADAAETAPGPCVLRSSRAECSHEWGGACVFYRAEAEWVCPLRLTRYEGHGEGRTAEESIAAARAAAQPAGARCWETHLSVSRRGWNAYAVLYCWTPER